MQSDEAIPTLELLTFRIGGQDFGIELTMVREIRGWTAVTPIPLAPGYVRGIVNLRGVVLAIVDLAQQLGLPSPPQSARTAIIVTEIHGEAIGLMVEMVSDILAVNPQDVRTTPPVANTNDRECVSGIVLQDDRTISILKVDQIIPAPIRIAA